MAVSGGRPIRSRSFSMGLTPKEHARNVILGAIEVALKTLDLDDTETPAMAENIRDQMRKELERLENRWGFSR